MVINNSDLDRFANKAKKIGFFCDQVIIAVFIIGSFIFSMFTCIYLTKMTGLLAALILIKMIIIIFVIEVCCFLFYGIIKLVIKSEERVKARREKNRQEFIETIKSTLFKTFKDGRTTRTRR